MGTGSPTAYLLWAILSSIFFVFLVVHLWCYDRFNCLRWDAGRQPGAFKRVMTYSYLTTVPLIVVFSVAFTILKYKEGYVVVPAKLAPTGTPIIIPKPFAYWTPVNKRWVLPLYFVLSFAWGLELTTHLEELTFWVFLLNQGPGKREWFASWEFRTWTIGSTAAISTLPLIVLSQRHNLDACLAYIFLLGSAAGATTTVCFIYVLFRFPAFIRQVKAGGAEPDVVIRLTTFFQLNLVRVIFRFMFSLPLLLLGGDAIVGPFPIVGDPFASDFLLMLGGIGCIISSTITLLVFFPRSITQEIGYRAKPYSTNQSPVPQSVSPLPRYYARPPKATYLRPTASSSSRMHSFRFPPSPERSFDLGAGSHRLQSRESFRSDLSPVSDSEAAESMLDLPTSQQIQPFHSVPAHTSAGVRGSSDDTVFDREPPKSRRRYSDGPFFLEREGSHPIASWALAAQEEGLGNRSQLHPYVMSFTSPIDLIDISKSERGRPRPRHPS